MQEQHGIGRVEDVAFGGAVIRLERAVLDRLQRLGDTALELSGTVGGQVKIRSSGVWLVANVHEMHADNANKASILVGVEFLGEGDASATGALANFRRGITRYPRTGDEVFAVNRGDLINIFNAGGQPHIEVGAVYPTSDVRAGLFIDELLGRHFALVGSTGSGKSSMAALMLHRIIERAPNAHIVVLDPHGEYGSAFPATGKIFNVDNLELPYWLMNFEEHCEVFITSDGVERELDKSILARCLLRARSQSTLARTFRNPTVDSPLPYRIPELLAELNAQIGKLDNSNEIARYVGLKNRIENVISDPRHAFMFKGRLATDSMKDFLARILRMDDDGKPISIVDLSGVPSDIVSVVVALLSRIVMDHAMWAQGEPQRPVLIVCEEAHRYIPADGVKGATAARKSLERIAKEGRKYGVALALITQRPSDLAEGALSQCGTIISMRLNNDRDQNCVRNALPEGGRSFVEAIPGLRRGECIICGEGVAIPVRVRIDQLSEHLRPRSHDPLFSRLWTEAGGESDMLDRTIFRWRSQTDRLSDAQPATGAKATLLRPPVNAMLVRDASG